jgi:hypothetical protein
MPVCVLFGVSLILASAGSAPAADQGETKAIVDKALKARGGEAKLAKLKAASWKSKGTAVYNGEDIPFTADWTLEGARKNRIDADAESNSETIKVVIVLNGDKGWFDLAGNVDELNDDRLKEEQERAYVEWLTTLLPLKDKSLKLSPLGESKVADRDAVGISVSSKGHRDVSLYFDKAKGRLLKSETRVKDVDQGAELTQVVLYSDFKESDGVTHPTKLSYKRDGNRYIEMEISDFKLEEKAEGKLFEKP